MKTQLCFVLGLFFVVTRVDGAAVRVRIANNPYLYEIAHPSVSASEISESRAIPVHPVRGFQAQPSETRARRAEFRAQPANSRVVSFGGNPSPAASAALTEPEETTTEVPKPYKIQYDSVDANGTQMRREETKDDKGVVRGSYSYTDPLGIFRVVEYIADENGFRASIRTNEPGIGKADNGDPASVIYEIDPLPEAARAASAAAAASRAARAASRAASRRA